MKTLVASLLALTLFASTAFAAEIEATATKAPSSPDITIVKIQTSEVIAISPCSEDDAEDIVNIFANGYAWYVHGENGAKFWAVSKDDAVKFRIGNGSVQQVQ